MTETKSDTTIDLLRKVAEDAQDLISCNCSYERDTPPEARCDGTCTHSMAVRALQQLQAQPRAELASVAAELDAICENLDGCCAHAHTRNEDCYLCAARKEAERALATVRQLQAQTAATSEARLADVVGTVSIEGGLATLPDGSTVDLKPASSCWYLVTARLAFDEEDTCYTLQATSTDDAMAQATEQLRENLDADEREREDARDVYINYVVRCGAVEPEIGYSPNHRF